MDYTELRIGKIARPHGVRGSVLIDSVTDTPELRWQPGQTVLIGGKEFTVSQARPMQNRLLVTFDEISSREDAQNYQHLDVLVRENLAVHSGGEDFEADNTRSALDEDDEDESWHIQQLQGMGVALEDGQKCGTVRRVLIYPAQELLEILTPSKQTVLLPFVYDFILEVDLEGGRIIIDPPGGLFEELDEEPDSEN